MSNGLPNVGGQCALGCSIDVQTKTQASRFWLFGFCVVINDAIALDDADDDEPTGRFMELCWAALEFIIVW